MPVLYRGGAVHCACKACHLFWCGNERTPKGKLCLVSSGYPSVSYLYSAAETIIYQNKPTYLYYFGDYDPSGIDIPRNIEARLREFAPNAEINFQPIAVNPNQIVEMSLPTRPTKKTDSRSKDFEGESVEVDAIPPGSLREMANECIEQHVDMRQYAIMLTAEDEEKKILEMFANVGDLRGMANTTKQKRRMKTVQRKLISRFKCDNRSMNRSMAIIFRKRSAQL